MNANPHSPKPRHSAFQRGAFLLALAAVTLGFVYVIRHFLLMLFLAAVFTGMAYPMFEMLARRVRSRPAAAGLTIAILTLGFLLPVGGVAFAAYQQALELWNAGAHVKLLASAGNLGDTLQSLLPRQLAKLYPSAEEIAAAGERALAYIGVGAGAWITGAANTVLKALLMLLFMFYFFIDGPRMLDRIVRWAPLPDGYERALFARFLVVGRGAFLGIFVIGAIQGLITALLLWATGVPSPVLLGVLTMFASVLPAVGAGLVWAPAGIYLLFTQHPVSAIIVFAVGILVISTVDNLLRPVLVGKSIKMHDSMVLVSTLGGLVVFGLPGVIIGPILAALLLSTWEVFGEMFADELEKNKVV